MVIDANHGGLSGAELRDEIENRGARLAVIGVTAEDDAKSRRRAAEMGAVGFFRKPVDGTALRDVIEWVLGTRAEGIEEERPSS